ncbi:MAG: polyprenol monophosphomannose synthase [Vulcanimicrobiota bacterium]
MPSSRVVSIVVPTFNESGAIEALIRSVDAAMKSAEIEYEVVVVDDNSPDGTADLVEGLAGEFPVMVVRRAGKLGLSSAVIDGWIAAQGDLLGVMDADGSHDEKILPAMVHSILEGEADVAVGSRYVRGGGCGDWPMHRQLISRVAVLMGRIFCPVHDLTSGFMVLRREVVVGVPLDPIGFKIGLEVLVRGRFETFTEVPYVFKDRVKGRSKLGYQEVYAYLVQLSRLFRHYLRYRPRRRRVAYWTG